MIEKLDKEVIPTVNLLNSLEGIKTFASCSGHGDAFAYVSFQCSNITSFCILLDAFFLLTGFHRRKSFRKNIHNWKLNYLYFRPYDDDKFTCDIRYIADDSYKPYDYKIKTGWAWRALYNAIYKAKYNKENGIKTYEVDSI